MHKERDMDTQKLYTHAELMEFIQTHVTVVIDTESDRNNYGGYSTTVIAQAVLKIPGEPDQVISEDYYSYSD
jgi:hypothetical protein